MAVIRLLLVATLAGIAAGHLIAVSDALPDPEKVPVSEEGYDLILALKSAPNMTKFVKRVVEHTAGEVSDADGLSAFASKYSGEKQTNVSWQAMVSELGLSPPTDQRPAWANWDKNAACVGDREASLKAVLAGIVWACNGQLDFNCSSLPKECIGDTLSKADYIMSAYYDQLKTPEPLRDCFFRGGAALKPVKLVMGQDSACIVTKDPASTALSQEGYKNILGLNSSEEMLVFMKREVSHESLQVTDNWAGLKKLAQNPPKTFKELLAQLSAVPWTCGPLADRDCPASDSAGHNWTWLIVLIILLVLLLAALFAAYFVNKCRKQTLARTPTVTAQA